MNPLEHIGVHFPESFFLPPDYKLSVRQRADTNTYRGSESGIRKPELISL